MRKGEEQFQKIDAMYEVALALYIKLRPQIHMEME